MKPKIEILITGAVAIIFIAGCNSGPKNITLRNWVADKEKFDNFYNYSKTHESDCDSLENLYDKLELKEFEEMTYLFLAKCFAANGNEEKAKKYLLKDIATGRHISWIDSTEFPKVYQDVKNKYPKLNHNFWSRKDTSYFAKLGKMVYLDQSVRQNPIDFDKMIQIDKSNTKWLLEYCKENGFPLRPSPSFFNSEYFRVHIDPSILAIHAQKRDKFKLLNYAIKGAEKGRISWRIPKSICVTFFTRTPNAEPKPLRLLYFDDNNELLVEKSYLQLYSVYRYINDNNFIIEIKPSKSNSLNKNIILEQLTEIKTALIKEFSAYPGFIEISETQNRNENDLQELGSYNYIIAVVE